jgi:hypothetical protein
MALMGRRWKTLMKPACDSGGGENGIALTKRSLGQVRSFSRSEKLWLKIHTGSSRTVYSNWVEKALLFPS